MKQIYFHEFNIPTNNTIYFPYSSGLLTAYCQKFEEINRHYEFMPFFFVREPAESILSQYDNPSVACFSSSMWNFRLNLKVASLLKEKHPNCLIIFGGPNITLGDGLYKKYPFIDIGIFGEGEKALQKILIDNLYGNIKIHPTIINAVTTDNLDEFPSPYTNNLFDSLIKKYPDLEFKAIIETNRACPFHCSFCFYGQSDLKKKIVHHSFSYIEQETEWIARNKIKYVFCADANFGMYKKDIQVAQIYSNIKKKYQYPEKFRVCYGKNSVYNVFETAKILSESQLGKTVTIALQSNNPEVLKNIGRANIKKEMLSELQSKYTTFGIPTYTELILGLPGETYDSFLEGLDFILETSKMNQVFIYHCQVLPNTEMDKEEYRQKYKLKTVFAPLAEVHGNVKEGEIELEYEELIVSTYSMDIESWKRCTAIAWIMQLFYSLKVGSKISSFLYENYNIKYTKYFEYLYNSQLSEILYLKNIAQNVSVGLPRCQCDKKFGKIYYEPEEMTLLNIGTNKEDFYHRLYLETINFIKPSLVQIKELDDVFIKQKQEIVESNQFNNTIEYATKTILYGRKSNFNKPIGFQLI